MCTRVSSARQGEAARRQQKTGQWGMQVVSVGRSWQAREPACRRVHLGLFAALEGLLGLLLIGKPGSRRSRGPRCARRKRRGSEEPAWRSRPWLPGSGGQVVVFEGSREGYAQATLVCVSFPQRLAAS